MTAKVLQLVNSASVGLHTHIASPAQAVSLLGLGTLRAMVLLVHVFENFRVRDPVLLSFFESFHVHSMAVSQAARRIAQAESQNKNLVQEASIAGMLHDIGQLIFASAYQDRYSRIIKEFALFQEREISEAEISEFGARIRTPEHTSSPSGDFQTRSSKPSRTITPRRPRKSSNSGLWWPSTWPTASTPPRRS
jgi:HD-like signal output (HDOD) protein